MSKSKVFESKQLWLGEARGGVCAWDGCQAAFASDELPKGWSWLILLSVQAAARLLENSGKGRLA